MRLRLIFVLLLAVVSFGAFPNSGKFTPAVVSGYSGPGDITSGAIAFYSCGRAYTAAYATGLHAACDVVDTSTGLTTCTFHFLSTGFVNTTECNGSACAVACSITKMYDQTGTGNDVTQGTLGDMPILTMSAQNGLPCASNTGGSKWLITAANVTQALPVTVTLVGERTGNFTSQQEVITQTNQSSDILFANSTNTWGVFNGAAVPTLTVTDSAPHAAVAVFSASTPIFAVDSSGNTTMTTSGTSSISTKITVVSNQGSNNLFGYFCEGGIWPADLNSSYIAMLANMRSATVGWNF